MNPQGPGRPSENDPNDNVNEAIRKIETLLENPPTVVREEFKLTLEAVSALLAIVTASEFDANVSKRIETAIARILERYGEQMVPAYEWKIERERRALEREKNAAEENSRQERLITRWMLGLTTVLVVIAAYVIVRVTEYAISEDDTQLLSAVVVSSGGVAGIFTLLKVWIGRGDRTKDA